MFHLHKDLSVSKLRLPAPSQHQHSFLPPESSSATHSVHSHGNEHSSIYKQVTAFPQLQHSALSILPLGKGQNKDHLCQGSLDMTHFMLFRKYLPLR